MKINRAYKTELDPNSKNLISLKKHAGVARFAYNWGLARRIEEYKKTGKSPNAIEQHRSLNALKETEFPWMYEVSKCAPQEALRNLDRAYANFFRRVKLLNFVQALKEGKLTCKVGFPKFKSKCLNEVQEWFRKFQAYWFDFRFRNSCPTSFPKGKHPYR